MEVDEVEYALMKAYEKAMEVLAPLSTSVSKFLVLTLKAEFDEEGVIRLVIDIDIPEKYYRMFEALINEAVREATGVFEKELGIRTRSSLRLNPV